MAQAEAEADARPPSGPEWEYELRMPDGRLAGLHHVYELQAMVYAGKLPEGSLVRRPAAGPAWPADSGEAGAWKEPWTLPALRTVYELLGIEFDRPEGERRIAGWQRSTEGDQDEPSHVSVTMAEPPVSPPAQAERSNLVPLIVGTVLLLLVLLVVGIVLAS